MARLRTLPLCDCCGEPLDRIRSTWTKTCDGCTNSAQRSGTETTTGAYMRQRRERAGLTLSQCAEQIAFTDHDRRVAQSDLENLEANRPGEYLRLVEHLEKREVFPFEMSVFLNLAAATTDATLEMATG